MAVRPLQYRRAPVRLFRVARHAGEILEQLRAGVGHRARRRAAAEPRLVVRRLHRGHPADHRGVLRAAVLRAEDVVAAGLRGGEPHRVVAPGNDVRFHAEIRNEEAVDDVFRRHGQLHRTADRHVQLIELTGAVAVLQLPHPLLAHHVDLHRSLGRTGHVEEDLRAPEEHHHRDAERYERPQQLERDRAVDRLPHLVGVLAVVLEREHQDQHRNQQGEERRHGDEKEVQRVDLRRLLRRLLPERMEGSQTSSRYGSGCGPRSVARV